MESFTFLMLHVMAIVTHRGDLFLSQGKKYLHSTVWHATFGYNFLTQTSIFVQIETSLTNDFVFSPGQDVDLHFSLFI